MMDTYMAKLNDVSLCGIKTAFWREFLKAFQESTTDTQARAALDRLRQRVQQATDLPSPRAQAIRRPATRAGQRISIELRWQGHCEKSRGRK
jgi:hypothetical protein